MTCGAGRRDWEWTRKCDQWCLMTLERKKELSTRRSSAKSLASNVRVRHAVKALTSAMRID
jgi:hypothetical protein